MTAGASVGSIYGQMILDTSQYEAALRQMVGLTTSGGKNMEKSVGDLGKRMDELEGKTDKSKRTVGEFTKTFQALGGVMGAGAIVAGFKNLIDQATQAESRLKGLAAVVKDRLGQDAIPKATSMVSRLSKELGLTEDAVAGAMKNLTAMNFTLEQQEKLLRGATDIAVDNRQSNYDLSESVKVWTEGLKNNNSVLSDAIGVSENIAAQYKRLGVEGDNLTKKLEGQADRQKLVNDFTQQFSVFAGRAEENLKGWSGATNALNKNSTELNITAGQIIREALTPMAVSVAAVTSSLVKFSKENPTTVKSIVLVTSAVAGLAAILIGGAGLKYALDMIIGPLRTFGIAMNLSLGPIALVAGAITALILLYVQLQDAQKRFQQEQKSQTDFFGSVALVAGKKPEVEKAIKDLEKFRDAQNGLRGNSQDAYKKLEASLNKLGLTIKDITSVGGQFNDVMFNKEAMDEKIASLKTLIKTMDDANKKGNQPAKTNSGSGKGGKGKTPPIDPPPPIPVTISPNIDTGMFEGLKQNLMQAFKPVKDFFETSFGKWTQGLLATASKGIETYMAMLNAAANLAQVRLQGQVQNLNFLSALGSKQIDDNLKAVNSGLDAEVAALEAQKAELLRIEDEYQAALDERRQSEIEKIKARIEAEYQAQAAALQARYEADVQNQYDTLNNQDVAYANESTLTEDHLAQLNDLRQRFNDQEASDIESLNQTLAAESEAKKKNRVSAEKSIVDQLAAIEAQRTANQEAADKKKKDLERDNARLQWVLGMNAFNLQKQAAIMQAKVQTAMMIIDITRAAFSMIPFTLPILGFLPMAYQAGTMAISAASMQQYPPPPAAAFAEGGPVTGGQRGKDSVPAMLMPGELVVPEKNYEEVISAVSSQRNSMQGVIVNITGDMHFYEVMDAEGMAEQVKPILLREIRAAVEAI